MSHATRTIGVITTSRADFGIYQPVLAAISAHPALRLELYVTGMHMSPEYDLTLEQVIASGYPIAHQVETLLASDSPQAVSTSLGLCAMKFAQVFASSKPDILLVLGDRFEMFAATCAAIPYTIPIAHIHGGETTTGAMDEAFRHSLTKMSHVHFAATERYARRIIQLGEAPARVHAFGAPSLDNLRRIELAERGELEELTGLDLSAPPLLVTYHPVSLDYQRTEEHVSQVVQALEAWDGPIVITRTNADTSGRLAMKHLTEMSERRPQTSIVGHMGTRRYFGLMKLACGMVGNSSSGIIEAASFGLGVVDIGKRQHGRDRGENVVSVPADATKIREAISKITEPTWRASIAGMENPYGDGHASDRIADELARVVIDDALIMKQFYDMEPRAGAGDRS